MTIGYLFMKVLQLKFSINQAVELLIFKGKVKELIVNTENGNKYQVIFDYYDKITIGATQYGITYNKGKDKKFKTRFLKLDDVFSCNKELFDFISNHSCEILEVSFKKDYIIKKAKLSYE